MYFFDAVMCGCLLFFFHFFSPQLVMFFSAMSLLFYFLGICFYSCIRLFLFRIPLIFVFWLEHSCLCLL